MNASSVDEIGRTLQRFGAADYVVFTFMLLICVVIGIYYGFFAKQLSADEYLMGGRKLKTFPVSVSLIASFISGITLLGTPTEMYLYGIQYMYIWVGITFMGIAFAYAYLPVLQELKLTSSYEYLELRFDKYGRLFGSLLFVIASIIWVPIVIYVPALAFNQVTGVNIHVVTPIVCLVCIFYTCVGGLRAVVWTDVVQTFVMFAAMILVVVKGTVDVGGWGVVWERNMASGRIEAPNLSLNPLERHTLAASVFGGFAHWIYNAGIDQFMSQRYLSLPNLKEAQKAVAYFVIGTFVLVAFCSYGGLVIYAKYYDCDPLTTKLAKAKDQLLPLLVMDTIGELPGLPGCFMAGVFSAALSSMSTSMNSMAAVILEDFYKPMFKKELTERQTNLVMKSAVVGFGVLSVSLVFIVEKLGAVLQLTVALGAMTIGPALGIFSMGFFLPWVNSKGMLAGGIFGLCFMAWIAIGNQAAVATGRIVYETKPLTVEGCTYDFVRQNTTLIQTDPSEVFVLFRLSYLWLTAFGCTVSMIAGLIVSFLTGPTDLRTIDHKLLSPVIRRFMPKPLLATSATEAALVNGYKPVELELISKDTTPDQLTVAEENERLAKDK